MRVIGVRNRPRRAPTQSDRIKRSVALGAVLAGILLGFLQTFLWLTPPPPRVNPTIRDAYFSACRIISPQEFGDGIGSGVLLDTGYILTARHNVDKNKDNKLDVDERTVRLEFYDERGGVIKRDGHVAFMSSKYDFALVESPPGIKSNISLQIRRPLVGDKVYTIGCPRGKAIHLTTGFQSVPNEEHPSLGRASISVYYGNSGGGIFDSNQGVVGIVKGLGFDRRTTRFTIPMPFEHEGGLRLRMLHGSVSYYQTLSNWCEYVKSENIYAALAEKNIEFTVVKPTPWDGYCPAEPYAKMSIQILLFLLGIFVFRKELFAN